MIFDNKDQKEEQKRIVEKWSWLLEGIETDYERVNTARILENAEYLMVQKGELASQWISEATDTATISDANLFAGGTKIPKVIFPIIRRVFPNLIANNLVSTQALSQPSGLIFYLTYKFDTSKGGISKGDEYSAFPYADNDYSALAGDKQGFSSMYSSNKIGPLEGTKIDFAAGVTFTAGHGFITPDDVSGIEIYNLETRRGIDPTTVGSITYGADTDGMLNEVTISNLPEQGAGTGETGDAGYRIFVKYSQESTTKIPEMSFSMDSTTVNTDSRKMRANWTKEGEQDWKAWHSIDVEQELVKIISQEMAYETDREVINYVDDQVLPGMSFLHDFSDDTGNGTVGNFLDRHLALTQKVLQIAALIHQYNRMGKANWLVCSPQMATIFETLKGFNGTQAFQNSGSSVLGVIKNGNYKNQLDIYSDPNRSVNDILIGYKSGVTPYGGGVVYAPYTNWMSPVVYDPSTFNPTRGFFTRYGLTTVPRGRFNYAKMTVSGLTQQGSF
jgi:hypothetical protein